MATRPKVVILGANSGVGLSVTEHLLNSDKWEVCATYRRSDVALRNVFDRTTEVSRGSITHLDLSDEQAVLETFRDWEADGNFWGVINLAGVAYGQSIRKSTAHEILRNFADNITPAVTASTAFAKAKASHSSPGRLIHFSSVLAINPVRGTAPYAAAKSAIETFALTASMELAQSGILVNVIRLGYVDAGMAKRDVPENLRSQLASKISIGRLGALAEIAPAIDFLLDPVNSYTTGAVIPIHGGYVG